MANADDKINKGGFQKKEHRPWKTSLLEMTVQETEPLALDDEFEFKLDLESACDEPTAPFYTEFNFIDDTDNSFDSTLAKLDTLNLDGITSDLKSEIKQTQQQKKDLISKLHDRSTNSIMLGGFFQPQQLGSQSDTPGGRRMNSILTDLKTKEHRLSALTRDLELSEAKERVELAEINKKAEVSGRMAAENRMREAIEQAQVVAGQFRLAMEQANQAVAAHREEEKMRMDAEDEAKEAKIRANNAELSLQNERMARISAEEKTHDALSKSENTQLLQQQLMQTKEQLQKIELAKTTEENRRLDAEKNHEQINDRFIKLDNEHRQCSGKMHDLEHVQDTLKQQISALEQQISALEQKIKETTAQRDKLKDINTTEQKLRKIAEQKMQDALRKAEQAEKARAEEEKQRKIVDERAKRAVAHASRTVMHILNSAEDEEYSLKIATNPQAKAKPKIKVPSESTTQGETAQIYDFEDDDFNF